jgi:tRNA 2-selenouridine synthase
LGIEIVSQKLLPLYDEITKLKTKHRNLVVYCERGGMRSGSLCSLFSSLGLNVIKLKDGYKGYRAAINSMLPKLNDEVTYVVIHGFTGIGKTEILDILEQRGHDVINLERAANHRGSLLGKVGLEGIVSQKQFESIIFDRYKNRKGKYIFIEAESGRIGNIIVPKYITEKMRAGKHILVQSSIEYRTKRIVDEYIKDEMHIDELLNAIEKLEKHIGKNKVNEYKQMINNKQFDDVASELMIKYYDPLYYDSQVRYQFDLEINSDDIIQTCDSIEKWLEELLASEV